MSIVPYRKAADGVKRRTLDQRQVVKAALELLDEVGLDELTMRRVAERLDVQAASLYRHVRNKEELLVLLGDEISGEIPLAPSTGPWRDRFVQLAWDSRRGLAAHRDAARVLAITPPMGPRRLKHIESLLCILEDAGLTGRDAARVAYHCNNFVTEFAADEARFASMASASGVTRRKLLAMAQKSFRSLPPEEYPTLVAWADFLTEDDSDGLFEFGLNVWLAGISALIPAARKR